MDVRTGVTAVVALLLVGALGGCTQEISGTPGPRPTVSGGGGDFPSASDSPSDEPTEDPSESDSPTDEPTDEPTDTDTPSEDGSVQTLCSDMQESIDGPELGAEFYQTLVGLDIIGWGIANEDSDPFSTVDAATTSACPDVRTAVLAKTETPDLKTIGD